MTSQKITLIGSGNVATHLAKALYQAGNTIVQIWSREYDHAETLAHQVQAKATDSLRQINNKSDIYILAVHDDALYDLALDLQFRDSLVLHTSGSVGMSVLRPISRHHGVIWSPQTFVREIEMDYKELPFCIEGSSATVEREISELLQPVSHHIFTIDSTQRRWLHLASVMVNNFGNAINALAQDLLQTKTIPFEILHPLVRMTAQKVLQGSNLWQLQTGPAVRHDQKTIDEQRKMLSDNPRMLQLYELVTELIQDATN